MIKTSILLDRKTLHYFFINHVIPEENQRDTNLNIGP